ncbi:MAG: V-type ATP synthase subunit I [Spirochaetaceae bacterium]|jgi:V/A-type H+-transporting ATPase subunit I|nr:V-type ATP synthase subunit I [Spirochaetaceae bacterium]
MKKVTLVGLDKFQEENLTKLRELGLIHLKKKDVQSDVLSRHLERRAALESAAGILRSFTPKKRREFLPPVLDDSVDIGSHVLDLSTKRKIAQEQIYADTREISRIEKWGDFDPAGFESLVEYGIGLSLYEIPKKAYADLKDQRVIVFGRDKLNVYCASESPLEGLTPFQLPDQSLTDFRGDISRQRKVIEDIEKQLSTLSFQISTIDQEIQELSGVIEFETAKAGMDQVEDCPAAMPVSCITGFVPAPELGRVKRAAADNGWALYAVDPADGETPPTLIKNNPVVRLIQPLFSFLGTVPGYREYDISPSYLLFFSIFVAMIFGDAAYGCIIFIVSIIAGLSVKRKTGRMPEAAKLFTWLGFCIIVWGGINGTWFSIPYESLPPFLQALVIPQFNSGVALEAFPGILKKLFKIPAEQPNNTAYWNIQFLCFSIAIIQLVYAHLKNIKKLLPSLVALAQLGWLVMMIGLYFLVLSMLLKVALPDFAVYFIGIGLGVYFIFAEQTGGNPFANVLRSFSNFLPTFLNAVGSFADIISYIRLFAVGLAGSAIAQSFNSMSAIGGLLSSGGAGASILEIVLKFAAAILILIFGHGLNLMMNALSVIVHGVRLNLLEYAGNHLSMEWSGYSYKPFAVKQKKNT